MKRRPPVALVPAVDVPLAKIGGVEPVLTKGVGNGGHLRRHLVLVARHALVRIEAGQHRTAKGAAQRKAAHSALIILSLDGQAVDMRGVEVGIAVAAQGMRRVLVAQDPEGVLVGWSSAHVSLLQEYGGASGSSHRARV